MAKSDQEMYAADKVMRKRTLEHDVTGQREAAGRVNVKGKKSNRKGDAGIYDESIAYDND